jgi:hypothetical protein
MAFGKIRFLAGFIGQSYNLRRESSKPFCLDLFGFAWDGFAQRLNPGLQRGPVGNGLGCLSGPRYPLSVKAGGGGEGCSG